MLNSNQVNTAIFNINDINNLNLKRLKEFKKACERKQFDFIKNTGIDNVYYIKTHPDLFTDLEHSKFKIWSTNMTNIRRVIENKSTPKAV